MARKEKKYHFIYKTTNLLSGRYYIGMHSTDDLDDGYLGSGTRLRRAINKHGKQNFKREILEFCKTRKELKSREEDIVNLNEIAKVDCMNLKVGGYGGFSNDEHRIKSQKAGAKAIHKRLANDKDFKATFKTKVSDGLKKAYKDGWECPLGFKGKKHSEESKKKISESSKGQGKGSSNSQFGTCWITNEKENKKIKRGDAIPKGWRLGRKIK
jgi:hypothetical protein